MARYKFEIPEFKGDEDSGYEILLGVARDWWKTNTSFVEEKKWMPPEIPKKESLKIIM